MRSMFFILLASIVAAPGTIEPTSNQEMRKLLAQKTGIQMDFRLAALVPLPLTPLCESNKDGSSISNSFQRDLAGKVDAEFLQFGAKCDIQLHEFSHHGVYYQVFTILFNQTDYQMRVTMKGNSWLLRKQTDYVLEAADLSVALLKFKDQPKKYITSLKLPKFTIETGTLDNDAHLQMAKIDHNVVVDLTTAVGGGVSKAPPKALFPDAGKVVDRPFIFVIEKVSESEIAPLIIGVVKEITGGKLAPFIVGLVKEMTATTSTLDPPLTPIATSTATSTTTSTTTTPATVPTTASTAMTPAAVPTTANPTTTPVPVPATSNTTMTPDADLEIVEIYADGGVHGLVARAADGVVAGAFLLSLLFVVV
eukprot:GEMP01040562.1.p1 GENE.GEMP01040562.1~~GEMP01040562.1.p1  ORF type:complete len:382 (+),score=60.92 GEMP01040562.1:53-1147(+)